MVEQPKDLSDKDPELSERALDILEAAARIFAEKGYDRTSMRDISEASGVSKALLYHHFSSKDEIYTRIAFGSTSRLYDFVVTQVPSDRPASERIRIFMMATAEFFQTHRWAWIAASNSFWSDPSRHQQVIRMQRRREFELFLRRLIHDGVEAGEFAPVDPVMAGRLILSSLNWMHRWFNPEKSLSAADVAGQYADMLLAGLQKR